MRVYKQFSRTLIFIIVSIIAISAFSVVNVHAEEDTGMKTKVFNTSVVVNKDNSFEITETIKVNLLTSSRGIIREIPITNSIIRQDNGKTVEYKANVKIKDVQVKQNGKDANFETYTESGNYFIRIGDENTYIDGTQKYEITYLLKLPKDRSDEYDSVYLNVIPRGWSTSIEKSKVSIEFPTRVDLSKAEFIGEVDEKADTDVAKFSTKSKGDHLVVTAKTTRPIAYGEGMTFKVDLPDGYFEQPLFSDWQEMLFWILTILIPILCILAWFLLGRDRHVTPTVEFYPPEGMTSAQAGYLIDGKFQEKDLISMFLYWADKGYIEIEEVSDEIFVLHKIKDLSPRTEYYERELFNGTFSKGDSVNIDDLDEEFGEKFYSAKGSLMGIYERQSTKIFDTKSLAARNIGLVLSVVPAILYILFFLYPLLGMEGSIYALAPFLIIYGILYGVINSFKNLVKNKAGIMTIIIIFGVFAFAGIMLVTYLNKTPEITSELFSLTSGRLSGLLSAFASTAVPCICAILSGIIGLTFAFLSRKRTDYYVDVLGKLQGFKNFIGTAEVDRINMMVKENPKYFFDVLPFAWVFDLTDEWVKTFENIDIVNPDWYRTYRTDSYLDTIILANMIRSCNRNIERQVYANQPQSEGIGSGGTGGHGGGFSGGGGVSGGGFGGGGGGRW